MPASRCERSSEYIHSIFLRRFCCASAFAALTAAACSFFFCVFIFFTAISTAFHFQFSSRCSRRSSFFCAARAFSSFSRRSFSCCFGAENIKATRCSHGESLLLSLHKRSKPFATWRMAIAVRETPCLPTLFVDLCHNRFESRSCTEAAKGSVSINQQATSSAASARTYTGFAIGSSPFCLTSSDSLSLLIWPSSRRLTSKLDRTENFPIFHLHNAGFC